MCWVRVTIRDIRQLHPQYIFYSSNKSRSNHKNLGVSSGVRSIRG